MGVDLGVTSIRVSFQWDPENLLIAEIHDCTLPPRSSSNKDNGLPLSGNISIGAVMLFVHAFYRRHICDEAKQSLLANKDYLKNNGSSINEKLLTQEQVSSLQYRDLISGCKFDHFEKMDDKKYRLILTK